MHRKSAEDSLLVWQSFLAAVDPANPLFYDQGQADDGHLGPEDALLVDVTHTSSGPLLQGFLGVRQPVGHVDFYPNGEGQNSLFRVVYIKDNDYVDVSFQ